MSKNLHGMNKYDLEILPKEYLITKMAKNAIPVASFLISHMIIVQGAAHTIVQALRLSEQMQGIL